MEDSPELNVSEYTVAFWFAADAPDDGTQALIARGEDWAGDKAQWVVELNDRASRGKVQLWYEEANDRDHYFPTQTSIEADTWYHFAATRTADGKVTIYLNGQVELQRTDPADPASVETPITIGARRNSPHNVQDYFDGIIHHVLVYGHALDDARVNEILAETRPECWIGDQTEVSAIGRQADVAVADDAGSIATGQMPDGSREPPELGGLRLPGAGVRLGLRAGRGLPDLPPGMMKRSGDRPDAHAVSVPSSDDAVIIHRQHPCLLRPSARPGRLARHDTRPAAEAAAVGPDCAPILLPRWLRFACRLPSAEVRLHLRATTVPAKAGVGGGDVGAQG